jgi:hypothetical protein
MLPERQGSLYVVLGMMSYVVSCNFGRRQCRELEEVDKVSTEDCTRATVHATRCCNTSHVEASSLADLIAAIYLNATTTAKTH